MADAIGSEAIELPADPLLYLSVTSWGRSVGDDLALIGREVDRIIVRHAQRRVDFRWVPVAEQPRWQSLPNAIVKALRDNPFDYRFSYSRRRLRAGLLVARESVIVEGADQVGAIMRSGG